MRAVPDPRCDRKKKHVLAEILTCLVIGYMSGHTALRRCLAWCERHLQWLRQGMDLQNGIASVSTVSRLLSTIDEELFVCEFTEWISQIVSTKQTHLAIDGKALCAAAAKIKGENAPLLLNVIEVATKLVITQRPIDNKDNEIIVIPEVLNMLDIKGSTITVDAIGTQTAIIQQITDQGGHYVLLVKRNQSSSYDEIVQLFGLLEEQKKLDEADRKNGPDFLELLRKYDKEDLIEKNRDRYEYRSYRVCNDASYLTKAKKEWPSVKALGYIGQTRILIVKDEDGNDVTPDRETFLKEGSPRQPNPAIGDSEKSALQVVGIISDMELKAKDMGRIKRNHWRVENCLHHVLDDTFREDRSPAKGSKNNLALIRKFAYNLIRIAMLTLSIDCPITEMMDRFADDLELMGRFVFKGIGSFY